MSEWNRVTKAHPCPVCGRPDWCIFAGPADNPAAAICARTESPKVCGAAGVNWAAKHPAALDSLANGLGVSVGSLRRLRVGYSPDRRAWLFPMRTPAGEIRGVRLRLPGGRSVGPLAAAVCPCWSNWSDGENPAKLSYFPMPTRPGDKGRPTLRAGWWRWTRNGLAPRPRTIGHGTRPAVRWSRRELMEWIEKGCPRVEGAR